MKTIFEWNSLETWIGNFTRFFLLLYFSKSGKKNLFLLSEMSLSGSWLMYRFLFPDLILVSISIPSILYNIYKVLGKQSNIHLHKPYCPIAWRQILVVLPILCLAELPKYLIFLNLVKSLNVYMYGGVAHALGKAHPHGRPGRRGAGRQSGLWPYPPLAATRTFSIVAPSPKANRS